MQRFCHELLIVIANLHSWSRCGEIQRRNASTGLDRLLRSLPAPALLPRALLPPPQFEANAKWDAWNAVKGKATATAKEVRHGPKLLLLPCF
jgi:hypothetical protein